MIKLRILKSRVQKSFWLGAGSMLAIDTTVRSFTGHDPIVHIHWIIPSIVGVGLVVWHTYNVSFIEKMVGYVYAIMALGKPHADEIYRNEQ